MWRISEGGVVLGQRIMSARQGQPNVPLGVGMILSYEPLCVYVLIRTASSGSPWSCMELGLCYRGQVRCAPRYGCTRISAICGVRLATRQQGPGAHGRV